MAPLRVLHVGKFYPPSRGGMEKVVQVLCEAERPLVDSQVLVSSDGPTTICESVHGVPVTRVAAWTRVGSVTVCPTLPLWMRRLRSDVVVIHEPNPVALVAHALARPTGRLVVWFHAEVVRPQWRYKAFYRPFLRRVLRLADRIIVASPQVAEQAEELKDFQDKCVVIPYGIHLETSAPSEEMQRRVREIRAGADLNDHRDHRGHRDQQDQRDRDVSVGSVSSVVDVSAVPLVLFVGRMVPYKGVDVLLRALNEVDARAILVGEGPLKAAWQQLSADLGLSARVQFAGEVDQTTLSALYHACDLFVLPSVTRAEAFGVVQLEAMACRKPVVSTLLPSGVPWVNIDGETGIVVPPGDVPALRDALRTLAGDPALRARMGDRGYARVTTRFTVERMVSQTTALYKSLVEQAAPTETSPSRVISGLPNEAQP
jgi:glycosyltransferase involved in cell wall biosynthesis